MIPEISWRDRAAPMNRYDEIPAAARALHPHGGAASGGSIPAVSLGSLRSLVLGCVDVSARMSSVDTPPGRAGVDAADEPLPGPEIARLLTNRQREVPRLLGLGDTNKRIAAKLAISHATVKLHVHHLMRALGVSNRTRAPCSWGCRLGT
jgi:DNA-binding NarL/FixJ family response regulator